MFIGIRYAVPVLLLAALAPPSSAVDTYDDDFSQGVSGPWLLRSNQSLYSMDDSMGDVRFSKPAGGTYGFQYINLEFRCVLEGDFDVTVVYRNASINRVNGSPANQVQLNSIFGNQLFSVVRDDDIGSGDNVHVYIDPPRQWRGPRGTSATSGTLRIRRTGSTVRGYHNSTLIHSATYNNRPVRRLWLSLQNNGTRDPTSVTFDDFHVSADLIRSCTGTVVVSGTVSSDCQGPLPGVIVDVLAGTEFISTLTMDDGSYLFPNVPFSLDDGEVSLFTPLGFRVVEPEDGHQAVVLDQDRSVDFLLECVEPIGEARGMGYWKHQARAHLSGRGSAQESLEDMEMNFPAVIFNHFHENELNGIAVPGVTYRDDGGTNVPLDLATIGSTLGVKHGDMLARAKQQYLACLLNMASGRIATYTLVSADDKTASQALQYLADLVNGGDSGDHALAKDIAEAINGAEELPAGAVPDGYDTIYYARPQFEERALSVFPNPGGASRDYTVSFSIPTSGRATVEIFNVAGRRVATVMSAEVPAGRRKVTWQGRDSGGRVIGRGVYFARLTTQEGTKSAKFIHLGE